MRVTNALFKLPYSQLSAAARLPIVPCIRHRQLSTTQCQHTKHNAGGFGICLDIDGVVLRGKAPIPSAVEAMKNLTDTSGKFKYPVVFLTNSSIPEKEKAEEISEIFNVQAKPEQFAMASSPLCLFESFHNKKCLFLGQDDLHTMAKNLGFTNVCTVEEVTEAFPLLNAIAHSNRPRITQMSLKPQTAAASSWAPVEAIVLLTSPLQWETVLQVTSDLLVTQGDPRRPGYANEAPPQLPVIACNPDMLFMHASHLPRFGHGSFILCLEQIYKKLTGRNLQYDSILGKPCEASFRFAEHRLNLLSQSLGLSEAVKTMYMVGDNQQVDIVGGNMYRSYVQNLQSNAKFNIPECRKLPADVDLGPQNVEDVKTYLVETGVYQENTDSNLNETGIVHSHRDFNVTKDLLTPYKICYGINDAIEDIFNLEDV